VVGHGLGQTRGSVFIWTSVISAICLVLLSHPSASPQPAPSLSRPDILFVQTPVLASGALAQRFPKGSAIVRLSNSTTEHEIVHLTDGFFAAADPQVSFDGTKVLFSGQKGLNDRWQVWEMSLDGSNKHQITQCAEDCLRGAYLPAEQIVLTVEGGKGTQPLSYLAVIKLDGSGFQPITFGTAPFQLETVLKDGRIVASAPWPLAETEQGGSSRLLYTLRPDGTALESFRCEHAEKAVQTDAEELQDGSLIFVRKSLAGNSTSGELVRIQQGTPAGVPLGARQAIYQSPRQLSDQDLVVAKEVTGVANSSRRFDLYLFHLRTGTLGERLYADPQLSGVQPVPVKPHMTPKHYWNTLNPDSTTGNFISLNSYLSADDIHGHSAALISQVRVVTVNSTDGKERDLGEAPVEADGSFFVKVPANWPIRFVLLDAKGQIIREEHGWIWTRPGEQRGCTGCHGDKAVAPENHWPQTLRRFDTPTPLGEIDHGPATIQAK
jgi:Hydrazine synthase alpha subunit middle domain